MTKDSTRLHARGRADELLRRALRVINDFADRALPNATDEYEELGDEITDYLGTFSVEVGALADRLWKLRADYQPAGKDKPEDNSETLSASLLESFASYLSCVAEDGKFDDDTMGGLAGNIENGMTRFGGGK